MTTSNRELPSLEARLLVVSRALDRAVRELEAAIKDVKAEDSEGAPNANP